MLTENLEILSKLMNSYSELSLRYPRGNKRLVIQFMKCYRHELMKIFDLFTLAINLDLYLELSLRYPRNHKLLGIQLIK